MACRYGRSLGIKPEEDKDLMWLAQQALTVILRASSHNVFLYTSGVYGTFANVQEVVY